MKPEHKLGLAFKSASIFVSMFLTGCAFPTFTDYDSARLSDQQVGILKNNQFGGCVFCISKISKKDGALLYGKSEDGGVEEFRLAPGKYVISYQYGKYSTPRTDIVTLTPGHLYEVTSKGIKDDTTGEIVVGEKAD
jgi:hypothetical protein